MMTKDQLSTLSRGTILFHRTIKAADGNPLRARVNGAIRTWKRNPARFQLPMKYGLKQCFYIDPANIADWRLPHKGEF